MQPPTMNMMNAEPQVQRADVLVVGRRDPAHDARRGGARGRRAVAVAVRRDRAGMLLIAVLLGCAIVRSSAFARYLRAACDLRRAAPTSPGLVAPGVARVGDDRGDLGVGQLLPRRHRRACRALAVQHDVDLRGLRARARSSSRRAPGMQAACPCRSAWWQATQLAA